MIDFAAARKKMVENQLRTEGVTDRRLLQVMAQLPREMFVPEARRELAYIDETQALPSTGTPRYTADPATFARLVQLAGVLATDRVLDVGCGSGYSAAVLAELARSVVAVESEPGLAAMARANLAELSIGALVVEGPLEAGDRGHGPYDVIVLEGAVEQVPPALLAQLADNGRLVTLKQQGATAVAHLYVNSGGDVASRAEFNANLPPLLPPSATPSFVF